MLTISIERIALILDRASEVEPADVIHSEVQAGDAGDDCAAEEAFATPAQQSLIDALETLTQDQLYELLALAEMAGFGGSPASWGSAMQRARATAAEDAIEHLVHILVLSDAIEVGLDRLGLPIQITFRGMAPSPAMGAQRVLAQALNASARAKNQVAENMTDYPKFFDDAPRLVMCDPLSAFLGATTNGMMEYSYRDAVKLAGHSCPTVAGAYLMTVRAVRHLYPEQVPQRGSIEVYFRDAASAGVTGVIARIAALLTGAAQNDGFKGIGGRFDRRNLLFFGTPLHGEVAFRRHDTGTGVEATFRSSMVPPAPKISSLLALAATGTADEETLGEFRALWQDRVRRILVDQADDQRLVEISDWAGPPAAANS